MPSPLPPTPESRRVYWIGGVLEFIQLGDRFAARCFNEGLVVRAVQQGRVIGAEQAVRCLGAKFLVRAFQSCLVEPFPRLDDEDGELCVERVEYGGLDDGHAA
eukprot:CAMPEP_0171673640 /NCGR_PEP_ID=MMETSP0990-20121206/52713_1 /TAXON_ID=483369 /ORGANISM="non described non described, Strain CCMP2098" /LENGTH=102 /DNA_ID=CAMNT_0012259175 /DNA_START=281 /DNA_END=589 /DNA_ORIENTATION=-